MLARVLLRFILVGGAGYDNWIILVVLKVPEVIELTVIIIWSCVEDCVYELCSTRPRLADFCSTRHYKGKVCVCEGGGNTSKFCQGNAQKHSHLGGLLDAHPKKRLLPWKSLSNRNGWKSLCLSVEQAACMQNKGQVAATKPGGVVERRVCSRAAVSCYLCNDIVDGLTEACSHRPRLGYRPSPCTCIPF